jgi:hypothetical protein
VGGESERRDGRRRAEDGTGLIGSTVGVLVFVVFLLLGVQVLFDLYARSAVTAATFDAARVVAGADAGGAPGAEADAEGTARRMLGHYGQGAEFRWAVEADAIALTVHVRSPSLLPALVTRPLSLDTIERTVRVRREHP